MFSNDTRERKAGDVFCGKRFQQLRSQNVSLSKHKRLPANHGSSSKRPKAALAKTETGRSFLFWQEITARPWRPGSARCSGKRGQSQRQRGAREQTQWNLHKGKPQRGDRRRTHNAGCVERKTSPQTTLQPKKEGERHAGKSSGALRARFVLCFSFSDRRV